MALEELEKFSDRELLARTLQAEAGNQSLAGKLAVGAVIRNRAAEGGYGSGIRGVITKPGHFSPLNYYTGYAGGEQGVDLGKIKPDKSTYAVADAILSGQYEDPTGGATHFYNPNISTPSWGQKGGGEWMALGSHLFGRANAGRESYRAPTSNQTYEARRVQYGLGSRGPGNTAQILDAVARGDMTKSEAGKYISEELLEGVEGGSAYDFLQDEKKEKERGMAMLGLGLEMLAPEEQAPAPELMSLPLRLSRRRAPATPGTQAIGRFGLESLLRGNPLLGIR
jgi:hypothetical protein